MRRSVLRFALFLACAGALLASAGGCFRGLFDAIPTGSFGCEVDSDCPDGYSCQEVTKGNGLCWKPGTGPDMRADPRDMTFVFPPFDQPDMATAPSTDDMASAPAICDLDCGATRTCVGGACLLISGQPCAQNSDCATHSCTGNFCD
jgi:hypothetical protein